MHLTSRENPTRYQIMTRIKSFQLREYVIGQQVNMEGRLIWTEEESIHETNQGQWEFLWMTEEWQVKSSSPSPPTRLNSRRGKWPDSKSLHRHCQPK